jgi:hypothetical protein
MVTNMKFGECLHFLLSTLDISINRLSKAINIDRSLVNRWINEKRTPSYNTTYIESISEYLSNSILNSFQEQHLNELFLRVCGDSEREISIKDKIKKILLQSQGYSIECKKKAVKESKAHSISKKEISNFLDNYQFGFEVDGNIRSSNPALTTYNPNFCINMSSEDKVIIGRKNVLSAGISLLEAAANQKCNNNNTIYISFNNELDINYDSGLIHLRNAVLEAINNGWNVLFLLRLNNNINRTIRFINFSKLLINTGKFHPYYLKKYDIFTTDKEFIIVPEIGALFCLSDKLCSGVDTAFYYKNNVAVNIFRNYFNNILTNYAHPLAKYYSQDNAIEYGYCMAESEESIGNRVLYKYDFSILTLPENLYSKLLQRKNLSHDEILTSLEFYTRRLKAFLSNIHIYEYTDIFSIDCINNLIKYRKFYFYYHNGVEIINLEVQDVIELLQNIIRLLEKYNNYNITFMSQNPDKTIQCFNFCCIVKEKKAVTLESYEPSKTMPKVRLSVEEPMLVKAFEEYFKEIWDQIAPINKDKKEIINWLQCQLNLLKNKNW